MPEYRTDVIGILDAEEKKFILNDVSGEPAYSFSARAMDPAMIGYEVLVHRNAEGRVVGCSIQKPKDQTIS